MQGKNPFFINKFRQGDHDAYNAMYQLHYLMLFKFANSILHNRQDAEDIVADIFVRLWKLRENFESPQNIKAFLFISVRNQCINHLKAAKLHATLEKEAYELMPTEQLMYYQDITVELVERLQNKILRLPPQQQQIIRMILYEGATAREIAKRQNLSLKRVQNLIYLAIAALRKIDEGGQLGAI